MTSVWYLLALFFSVSTFAASIPAASNGASRQAPEIQAAEDLLSWLEINQYKFAGCSVTKKSSVYTLCDNTQVNQAELAALFAMPALELVKHLESIGVKVEILCDTKPGAQAFAARCQKSTTRKNFNALSSLHGQYLAEEDAILIKSSASKGSLIHEYVHRLESKNQATIFGKIYKQSRNAVQANLVKLMDEKIAIIGKLESAGKKEEINLHLPTFLKASELLQKFAPWQDLIDERSIFLLYLNYGSEFGAQKEDLELARINMGHICRQNVWRGKLPMGQCSL